jgi:hypothetical protein
MTHKIPTAHEAKKKSDKANGLGVSKLLRYCQDSILSALEKGSYHTTVSLNGHDEDDRTTVTHKLRQMGYIVEYRLSSMTIDWSLADRK